MHGRQHFNNRLAIVASSVEDAVRKLEAYLNGNAAEQTCAGQVERNFRPAEKMMRLSQMLCDQVNAGLASEKTPNSLYALAQLYCKGIFPGKLYRDLKVTRAVLPGYPLEQKSYWIPEAMRNRKVQEVEKPAAKVIDEMLNASGQPSAPTATEKPKAPETLKTPETPEKPKEPEKPKAPEMPKAPAPVPVTEKKDQPAAAPKAPADRKEKETDMGADKERINQSGAAAGQSMEEILKELASSLAAELFMEEDEVSYDRSFMEMGLDSIVGVEWIRHLNKTYQMNLESTRLYQYPTLMELAAYIISLRAEPEAPKAPEEPQAAPAAEEEDTAGRLIPVTQAAYDPAKASSLTLETVRLTPLDQLDAPQAEPKAMPAAAQEKPAPQAQSTLDLEAVMKDLAESLAKELFMDVSEIRYDQSFMEMGLDSIVGVEWMRHINRQYQLAIESTKIYQYPTVIELAQYIASMSVSAPAASSAPKAAPAAPVQPARSADPAAPKAAEPAAPAPEKAADDDLEFLLEKIYNGEIDIDQADTDLFS